jgi:hypothetical protein
MTGLRLAVAGVLAAAVVAGCITYFLVPAAPRPAEADRRLPSAVVNVTGRYDPETSADIQRPVTKDHIEAFERAAEAILRRAQHATASAGTDKPQITGPVPLPKPRPVLPRSIQ